MRRTRALAGVGISLILLAGTTTVHADDGDDSTPTTQTTSTPTTVTFTVPVDDQPVQTGTVKGTAKDPEQPDTTSVTTQKHDDEPTSSEVATTATEPDTTAVTPVSVSTPTSSTLSTSAASSSAPDTTTGTMCDDSGCQTYSVPNDTTQMTIEPPGFPDGVATPAGGKTDAAVTTTTNAQVTQGQQTVITGTQVAGANTGGNLTVVDQPNTGVTQPPNNAIDTGPVDAIGTQDVNTVAQGADVTLTGNAVANLIQLALILNFGAADANSGTNAALAADGSSVDGSLTTGGASAVGNAIASYITQAANANADSALNDDTSQQALSLFLGLAVSNSGLNSILGNGAIGTGGSIDSGSAQAIGNQSVTDITQWAKLMGADDSVINVLQRATVLNLGFALANSGLNDISGVAGSLLSASDADDDALAEQLFAMLLPALLSQYGYGTGGAGQIATGGAQAIGNQSYTGVLQTAGVTASGDGVVNMVQDVLVANEGGALANTGLNTIGGVRSLDPESAKAVVQMAAFLSAILSKIHHSSSAGDKLAAESQGIDIPFGDFILHLDANLGSLDTTFMAGNARANVRQITVVISFGMARSNSGGNVAATMSDTSVLSALNAVMPTLLAANGVAPEMIGTGNADAGNHTLVQICQKINADDVTCLAPPPPPADDPPVDSPDTPVADNPGTPVSTAPAVVAPTDGSVEPTQQPQALGPRPEGFSPAAVIGEPANFAVAPTVTNPTQHLPSTGVNVDDFMSSGFVLLMVGGSLLLVRRRRRTV